MPISDGNSDTSTPKWIWVKSTTPDRRFSGKCQKNQVSTRTDVTVVFRLHSRNKVLKQFSILCGCQILTLLYQVLFTSLITARSRKGKVWVLSGETLFSGTRPVVNKESNETTAEREAASAAWRKIRWERCAKSRIKATIFLSKWLWSVTDEVCQYLD